MLTQSHNAPDGHPPPPLCAPPTPHLSRCSGEDRGPGSGGVHGRFRARQLRGGGPEDQEGHVPHGGTAVQRVPHQTDGHPEEHQPQLPALHHPQPREEGERAGRGAGRTGGGMGCWFELLEKEKSLWDYSEGTGR